MNIIIKLPQDYCKTGGSDTFRGLIIPPCTLYTVDVLPSAKAWRPMAMVYPVSAYV